MSDMDGMDAFNALLDRYDEARAELGRVREAMTEECSNRMAAERKAVELERDRDSWQRLAHQRSDEIGRLRSKLPFELPAAEPTPPAPRAPLSDDIPF